MNKWVIDACVDAHSGGSFSAREIAEKTGATNGGVLNRLIQLCIDGKLKATSFKEEENGGRKFSFTNEYKQFIFSKAKH